MEYDNNNSGLLARNKRKEKPTHPDHSGQCEVDGKKYWISAWIKEGKPGGKLAGEKFFSLSFKPQNPDPAAAPAAARPSRATEEKIDDDIPF